jgi:hypothetical protein
VLNEGIRRTDRAMQRDDPGYEARLIDNIYDSRTEYVGRVRDRALRNGHPGEARTLDNVIRNRYPRERRNAQSLLSEERAR